MLQFLFRKEKNCVIGKPYEAKERKKEEDDNKRINGLLTKKNKSGRRRVKRLEKEKVKGRVRV